MLVAAPGILADLPTATLAAVVIAAGLSLVDVGAIARLWRHRLVRVLARPGELPRRGLRRASSRASFFAVALSLLAFIRRAWWPHDAVLGRADGVKGYHDLTYYPEARQVPGLVLYRFDAPLFFANADVFRDRVRERIASRGRAGPLGGRGGRADHRRRHHGRRDARSTREAELAADGHHPRVRRAEGPGPGDRLRRYGALERVPRRADLPDRRDGCRAPTSAASGEPWTDWEEDAATAVRAAPRRYRAARTAAMIAGRIVCRSPMTA